MKILIKNPLSLGLFPTYSRSFWNTQTFSKLLDSKNITFSAWGDLILKTYMARVHFLLCRASEITHTGSLLTKYQFWLFSCDEVSLDGSFDCQHKLGECQPCFSKLDITVLGFFCDSVSIGLLEMWKQTTGNKLRVIGKLISVKSRPHCMNR